MDSRIPSAEEINSMAPQDYKVLENRLRRSAKGQGLRLEKSRARDPRAIGYGTYQLVDNRTNSIASSGLQSGYGLGLDDVARFLFEDRGTTVAPTPVLYGVDLSNNNFGGPSNPNTAQIAPTFAKIQQEGFSWIEFKCSQGGGANAFIDPYYSTAYQWCHANNFPVVAYHFVTTDPAAEQAQCCTSAVGTSGVPIMLDWEEEGGNWANYEAVYNAFIAAGINVRLQYIPQWYWEEQGSPSLAGVTGLVSSSWVSGTGYASVLYPGPTWAGWDSYGGATPVICQFTNSAQVAGMTCDADAFQGTLSQLQTLLGITVTKLNIRDALIASC